jgi:hypothetical protein
MKTPGRVAGGPPIATGDPTMESVPAESTAMTARVPDVALATTKNLPSGVIVANGLLPPVDTGAPFGVKTPEGDVI